MSILSEIGRLADAKTDIIAAIEEMGVDVPDDSKLDALADYIRSISTGAELNFQVVGGLPVYPDAGDQAVVNKSLPDASASGGNYYAGNNTRVITSSTVWDLSGCDSLTMTWTNNMSVNYWTNPMGSVTNSTRYCYLVFADGSELLVGTGTTTQTTTVDLASYTDSQKASVQLRGKLDYYLSTVTNAACYGSISATDVSAVGGGTSVSITVSASHANNGNSTSITIVDDADGSTVASKTITGTTYYSVFTDQVIEFTTSDGLVGSLKCSVRQNTQPFFIGTVVVDGTEIGTVGIGTGQANSSYPWSGSQTVTHIFMPEGQPPVENPIENTIWVNTDEEITGWMFDSSAPLDIEQGCVYISTGSSSPAMFNALKENCIMIYPLSAQQWDGTAWVNREVKIYQNGSWNDFAMFIVQNGVISDIGFNGRCRNNSAMTITSNNGYVTVSTNGSTTNGVATPAAIDVTNYSTLTLVCNIINAASYIAIGLSTALNASSESSTLSNQVVKKTSTTTGEQTLVCDISGYTGKYYPSIVLNCGSAGTPSLNIYDLYLS